MKETHSLNRDWKFRKAIELKKTVVEDYFNMFTSDTKTGLRSDYLGEGFYDGDWENVNLPHDWAIFDVPTPCPDSAQGHRATGEVIYRKCFTLDEEKSNKRIFLKFDAISIKSRIYVNGIQVAREECGYIPVFVEITDFTEPGKQIVITVVADSSIKEGWWYEGGGIYGNAYLIIAENSMFLNDGIYVCPKCLKDDEWEIDIVAEIDGDCNNLKGVYTIDELGVSEEVSFSEAKTSTKIKVKNPELWSVDEPKLYKMICSLYDRERLLDREEISFGFRKITFDVENGCVLNGKSIKLKGVCLHHDHAGVGVAVPYKLHKYRLQKLKEMGANAIRTSHNPQLKEFYRACDELGFLVMNETRHFSSTKECLEQLRKFIRRDRNHPCVVMWSLFNEEPLQCTIVGHKMVEKMKETVMKEDDSRVVTGGMNGPLEPEGVVGSVDIMGFNYLQYGYEPFHEVYPKTPIIGSETGSYLSSRYTAYSDMSKAKRCSFENKININRYAWSATPGETWRNIEDKKYVLGGFYWTGFDYRGECGLFPSNVSSFGAMDLCGFPKECYYMHKAVWEEDKTIYVVYYRDYKKNGDILINCYTNCEQVRLFFEKSKYKDYKSSKYEPLSIYIEKFKSAEFCVAGVDNGNEVCMQSVKIPTEPCDISVRLSQNEMLSDGEDICVVDVYLLDEKGVFVPTGDNKVTFNVSGGSSVIGVGNGDNTDITSDKVNYKNLYRGCCQMILQSNGKQEDTYIQIICDGVCEKTVKLKCEPVIPAAYIKSEEAKISVLSWRASDVHKEYPYDNISDLMFCWIPTTVGYGKNLMYSGKKGFGMVGGRITVSDIPKDKKACFVIKKICGNYDIYYDKELVYSGGGMECDLRIPIDLTKFEESFVVSVVFKLNGDECGITGKAYVEIL